MDRQELSLIEPDERLEAEYLAMAEEFGAAGEESHQGDLACARRNFASLVREWREEAEGIHPAPGRGPERRYWLVREGRILGIVHLRPRLDPQTEGRIGHIGYSVRPSERGKGYASFMLNRILEMARKLGMRRVCLTCRRDNLASARVIRKAGGVLQGKFRWPERFSIYQRYWIEL